MNAIGKLIRTEPVYLGAFIDAVITAVVMPTGVDESTKTLILAASTAFIAWFVRVASVSAISNQEQVAAATDAGINTGQVQASAAIGLLALDTLAPAPAKAAAPVRKAAKKR